MKERFYHCDFISNSFDTHPRPLYDGQQVLDLMAQPSVQVDIASIRERGCNEAKRYLPAVVWGGHFKKGVRRDCDIESSGLFCQDIDHISTSVEGARQYYEEHFAGREDELGIVFAHVSPSGDGLHVICLCQPNLATIADNQAWLAKVTDSEYDDVCKNIGRIYFLSTMDDILYNDLI